MMELQLDLSDLQAVQKFFAQLLNKRLGRTLAFPSETLAGQPEQTASSNLRQWLEVSDIAIEPRWIRDALSASGDLQLAGLLLRYFASKPSCEEDDRDKCDFLATFISRNADASETTSSFSAVMGSAAQELSQALGNATVSQLPPEARQLIRGFEALCDEIETLPDANPYRCSDVLSRGREIKTKLGKWFYHRDVLAACAAYNILAGAVCTRVFAQAIAEIETAIKRIRAQAAVLSRRSDSLIVLQHILELARDINRDWGPEETLSRATEKHGEDEHFEVEHFTQEVESPALATAAEPEPVESGDEPITVGFEEMVTSAQPPAPPHPSAPAGLTEDRPSALSTVSPAIAKAQESRLRDMAILLRSFALTGGSDDNTFALSTGKIRLSAAELDAFRVEYGDEKSFRAEFARTLRELVIVYAVTLSESEEYKAKKGSSFLWQAHADALHYLTHIAADSLRRSESIVKVARQRGLVEKINAITVTQEKLRFLAADAASELKIRFQV